MPAIYSGGTCIALFCADRRECVSRPAVKDAGELKDEDRFAAPVYSNQASNMGSNVRNLKRFEGR